MATRPGMSEIVEYVRDLIADSGGTPQFANEQIQRALDQYRREVRYQEWSPIETIASGGTVSYLSFQCPLGFVESTDSPAVAGFVNSTYAALTPSTVDWPNGRVTFATEPTRPVMYTGYAYDPTAAAADLCDMWAAALKTQVSFEDGDHKFQLRERQANIIALASALRQQSSPLVCELSRGDEMTL